VTGVSFILRALDSGAVVGAAVLCTEARYCSVLLRGADRLDRRFLPPAAWQALERELRDTLEAGPLPAVSAIAEALVPGRTKDITVQYVAGIQIDAPPSAVREELDKQLQALAGPGSAGDRSGT
jgi:hypothetical protein